MITSAQFRAAVAMIDITHSQLGDAVGVSGQTIGKILMDKAPGINSRTLLKMEKFFIGKNIIFLDAGSISSGGPGIRMKA